MKENGKYFIILTATIIAILIFIAIIFSVSGISDFLERKKFNNRIKTLELDSNYIPLSTYLYSDTDIESIKPVKDKYTTTDINELETMYYNEYNNGNYIACVDISARLIELTTNSIYEVWYYDSQMNKMLKEENNQNDNLFYENIDILYRNILIASVDINEESFSNLYLSNVINSANEYAEKISNYKYR